MNGVIGIREMEWGEMEYCLQGRNRKRIMKNKYLEVIGEMEMLDFGRCGMDK